MSEHPIKALGDMLRGFPCPSHRCLSEAIGEVTGHSPSPAVTAKIITALAKRKWLLGIDGGTININSLDPYCPHGQDQTQADYERDAEYSRQRRDAQASEVHGKG